MKAKIFILSLSLSAISLFTCELYSQNLSETNKDTIQAQAKIQKAKDSEKMATLKNEQKATKADARETKRVNREASDAAKQSKSALKTEQKAQKARAAADKQAGKATKAREKSDLN